MSNAPKRSRNKRQVLIEAASGTRKLLAAAFDELSDRGFPITAQTIKDVRAVEAEANGHRIRIELNTMRAARPEGSASQTPTGQTGPGQSQVAGVEKTRARELGLSIEEIEELAASWKLGDWRANRAHCSELMTRLDRMIDRKKAQEREEQ